MQTDKKPWRRHATTWIVLALLSTNTGLLAMWWLTGASARSYLATHAVPHKLEALLTLVVSECVDYGPLVTFAAFSALTYVILLVVWFKIVAPFTRMCVRSGRATKAAGNTAKNAALATGSAAKSAVIAKGNAAKTALASRSAELLTPKTNQQPTQPLPSVETDRVSGGIFNP